MGGPGGSVMSDVPIAVETRADAAADAIANELPALPEATPDGAELVPAGDDDATAGDGGEPANDESPGS
jgi:hypothetical protein